MAGRARLRIDSGIEVYFCDPRKTAIKREAGLDGKWLLRTSDNTLTPDDLADA